jgi:hypothetical protein
MPQIIDHIDKIARDKKRDVLFLEFHPKENWNDKKNKRVYYDYSSDAIRKRIIDYLNEIGVSWYECGHFASTNFMMGYKGQIYLDVPFDKELPLYKKLEDYLEYPDGTMRFETVRFCYVTLEYAMKNARHDEPGFWEDWAENF